MNEDIRYLGDVQRLVLREGDLVVLKVPGSISQDTAEQLRTMLSARLTGHEVLVLGDGMDIGVLTKHGSDEA